MLVTHELQHGANFSRSYFDRFAGIPLFMDNANIYFCENDDRFVPIMSWQSVSISTLLSVVSRRHLNCFRCRPYGTRNATRASPLPRGAAICFRSSAEPQRCSTARPIIREQTLQEHLSVPLQIRTPSRCSVNHSVGWGGSLMRPD